MSLSVVPDGTSDGSVRTETQPALFGDPVEVPIFPRAEPDLMPQQQQLLVEIAEGEEQLELFMMSYPEEERADVFAKLYFDADGNPRTRHRMLSAV